MSDAVCPLCGGDLAIHTVNHWEDGTYTQQCRCMKCKNEVLVDTDENGTITGVGID